MDLMAMWQQMGIVAKAVAVRALHHVDVVVRRGHRAHFHVHAGAQSIEAVRAAGGQAPEGRASEGRHRAVLVEELPLQPPRQGGARGAAGISVPAGERRRPEPRRPDGHCAPFDSARVGADRVGPEEGHFGARHHRLDGAVRRTARHGGRRHHRVPGHRAPADRAASARCRPVLPKRWSKPRSDWSSRFRRCGSTTT